MRSTTLTALALAAAAVIGLAGAGRAAEDGQVVSVAKKDFAAARLGRKGLDLLMEKNGRVYLVASPGEIAALAALRVACDRRDAPASSKRPARASPPPAASTAPTTARSSSRPT